MTPANQLADLTVPEEEKRFERNKKNGFATDKKLFSSFDIFKKKKAFFDLDGTIYLGNNIIDGSVELFRELKKNNVQYYFLSNNTSKVKTDYVKRINTLGIDCKEENIILPTDELAEYLANEDITDIYLLGNSNLHTFFLSRGISTESANPELVIVAFDTELTYQKMQQAALYIQRGVPYMATNNDLVCPTENGFVPDTGSICQMLETTTGVKPKKIFGKPSPSMILPHLGNVAVEDMVIIGDRIYTDMELAKAIDCDFILTLTGEASMQDISSLDHHKSFVINSIKDLLI